MIPGVTEYAVAVRLRRQVLGAHRRFGARGSVLLVVVFLLRGGGGGGGGRGGGGLGGAVGGGRGDECYDVLGIGRHHRRRKRP
jgi:hypothetical protein